MTKLCFIITGLSTGGAETVLLKLLQRMDRARFTPEVVSLSTLGEIGPKIQALGIPVMALDMRPGRPDARRFWRLVQHLKKSQPDLVHTWMYHADLLGGLAGRLASIKRVLWSIHHSDLSNRNNKRSTLWVVKVCAALSHWVPVHILSCSHRAALVHTTAGYAADKLHVIPNGFDLDRFFSDEAARVDVRAELGLQPNTPLVGLIARYHAQKNHLGFIDAASTLHVQMPQAHYLLAGTGVDAENADLTRAIAAKGLQHNIHLLGRRDDIPRLMAALDVLASPSHGEAFPNVLGEAMACGVPCVVTDVGDSAEIVGNTGRVVPAGDMAAMAQGLLELLCLPHEQRHALGQLARERIAINYEIGHVTRLYEAFYERAIAEKSKGAV